MNKLYSYKTLYFLFFLFTLASCKQESKPKAPQHGLITEHAMVVSAREEASQIGTEPGRWWFYGLPAGKW